jgi:hypothetical protein
MHNLNVEFLIYFTVEQIITSRRVPIRLFIRIFILARILHYKQIESCVSKGNEVEKWPMKLLPMR